jgi:hypothetical protein
MTSGSERLKQEMERMTPIDLDDNAPTPVEPAVLPHFQTHLGKPS